MFNPKHLSAQLLLAVVLSPLAGCMSEPSIDGVVDDLRRTRDAGPSADASAVDSGPSVTDAGATVADAGASTPDAGSVAVDAGASADGGVSTSPSGTWVAFTAVVSGKHDVFVSRPDGSERRQLTATPVHEYYPSWTPDGAALVVARQDAATGLLSLVEIDVSTLATRSIATGLDNATSPVVSPDGTEIAFEGRPAGGMWPDLYIVPRAGGVAMRLTSDLARDVAPRWTADGASIYFVSNRGGTFEVWAIGRDGSGERAITSGTNLLGRPAISADGRRLAVTVAATGLPAVVRLYDLTTMTWVAVPCDAGFSSPAFSADSATLFGVYQSTARTDVASFDVATFAGPSFVTADALVEASPASR